MCAPSHFTLEPDSCTKAEPEEEHGMILFLKASLRELPGMNKVSPADNSILTASRACSARKTPAGLAAEAAQLTKEAKLSPVGGSRAKTCATG
jgi:hypothetical protein